MPPAVVDPSWPTGIARRPSPQPRATRFARLRFARLLVLPLLALVGACGDDGGGEPSPPPVVTPIPLAFTRVVTGLAAPLHLTAPAGDSRLFVAEQAGTIRVVKQGQLLPTPFLDIRDRVRAGNEEGLMSIAFDPAYATNGHVFAFFSNKAGDLAIERYTATPGSDVADPTPTPVIVIPHPNVSIHNGGQLGFGPDGMLYLGIGDGTMANDPPRNAQNPGTLLGKMIRIDVRTLPYTIPPDNPFRQTTGARPEIWALGLRNPWRWAFGRLGGAGDQQLVIADVGQNRFEEVNVAAATQGGINYGWNVMEGWSCFSPATGCNTAGLHRPLIEYDRARGCSVIGGLVYRGAALPLLAGWYLYADFCQDWVAGVTRSATGTYTFRRWEPSYEGSILSFGEDAAGELYALTTAGIVYRITGG